MRSNNYHNNDDYYQKGRQEWGQRFMIEIVKSENEDDDGGPRKNGKNDVQHLYKICIKTTSLT